MPLDNTVRDKKFPMKFKWNEDQSTEFIEQLNAIDVKVSSAPSYSDLLSYIPEFVSATWEDRPGKKFTQEERHYLVKKTLTGRTLPTALETINLTFLVSNIDYIDVTHLIRHRTMSFSAYCTGDRDQRQDRCVFKPSIRNSEYWEEYKDTVIKCKDLYARMVDSKEISILDARTILPRCLENHYYFRATLKDLIHYVKQRIDRQIQPESDNIVAMKVLIHLVKLYPPIKDIFDLSEPDWWYVNSAQTDHSSNLYMPEIPRNDVFDYKKQWFVYEKQRSEMKGGLVFSILWEYLSRFFHSLPNFRR